VQKSLAGQNSGGTFYKLVLLKIPYKLIVFGDSKAKGGTDDDITHVIVGAIFNGFDKTGKEARHCYQQSARHRHSRNAQKHNLFPTEIFEAKEKAQLFHKSSCAGSQTRYYLAPGFTRGFHITT
jgi:hypothetical protein